MNDFDDDKWKQLKFVPKLSESFKEVLKEKNAWIEVAISEGKSIPEPKYMPLIYKMVS